MFNWFFKSNTKKFIREKELQKKDKILSQYLVYEIYKIYHELTFIK